MIHITMLPAIPYSNCLTQHFLIFFDSAGRSHGDVRGYHVITLPHLKLRAAYPDIALPDTCTGRRESYPGLSRCQWLTRIVSCLGGVTRLRCLDSAV